MKVVKCDICKEEIPESAIYKIVNHRFNRDVPHRDEVTGFIVNGPAELTADICLDCWRKIYNFAEVFSEDPHVKLVREDGEPV